MKKPAERSRRPTLRDVAAELDVSAKTVSNAYNRPDQLSADLRRQVLRVAAELGYAGPDPLAAGLRRGRVGAIGVVYANRLSYAFEDPVSRELLAGLTSVAEAAGSGLLLLPGSTEPGRRSAAMSQAVVDGVVAVSLAEDDPLLTAALARSLPIVVVDQPSPDHVAGWVAGGVPWVGIDDRAAAAEVAGHLLRLGHRRIGIVSFGLDPGRAPGLVDEATQAAGALTVTRERLAGYRDAAREAGLDWSAVPVWQGTDSTPEEGRAGAAALLAGPPSERPTALICLSDRLAEGAFREAARLGLRVPADLSLVGFDDARPLAADLGLTTVSQPSRRKGEYAGRALLDRLAGVPAPAPELLATSLVARHSTAAPQ